MKTYAAYRSTGLAWVGEIPSHWRQYRIGYLFTERREKASDAEFEPLSVTMGGIVPQLETAAKTDDGDNRKLVRAGDFVINSRSDRKGSSGLSSRDGSVSLISIVLTPSGEILGEYAHHLLRSQAFQEEFYRNGQGIAADLWSTPFSRMRDIVLPLPSREEQIAIARFLDRETTKIDALIAEQERLIALLQEKRQAVISHAVTKGLDPNVPTRHSGVEWMGAIPSHWDTPQLRHLATSWCDGPFGSNLKSDHYSEAGVRVVRLQNIRSGRFDDSNCAFVDPAHYAAVLLGHDVCAGDLLIAGLGDDHNVVGRACVAPSDIEPAMVKADVFRFRLESSVCEPEFVALQLTAGAQADAGLLSTGSTRSRIPLSVMSTRRVAVPPRHEQVRILEALDSSLAAISSSCDDAELLISLLRERRSALITAAVTGQIDVRGLVETVA